MELHTVQRAHLHTLMDNGEVMLTNLLPRCEKLVENLQYTDI